MNAWHWLSIAGYGISSHIVWIQQKHSRALEAESFGGGVTRLEFALNISVGVGALTDLAYLIYFGWTVVWWAPLVAFLIGLIVFPPIGAVLEPLVSPGDVSRLGFIGWPIAACLMFYCLHRGSP